MLFRSIDLIKLNFEKFNDNKKLILNNDSFSKESKILFKDEVNYALGNIIQNAILYSKIEIKIFLKVNKSVFTIKIEDDGDGFSRDVLDKLGEPYISKNKKGMGLGIFIAKNLIENMKGNIIFYNSNNNGAVVEINFDKTILI